ncbi:hypothetical protein BDW59DRAFT_149213 [Aspergillus cavernicola]|uniref:Uncharacterized protein n=1 Tax=Aspergillus cavernicola TaxID=176166 RepID=A0ABR4I5A3_9EURO
MLQTEEMKAQQPTGSTEKVSGAIDQMAHYTRAPMLQALQCIHCILSQSISVGKPSTKQYCLLSGILAQAQVAHHGDSEEQAVIREALLESMQTCRSSLQEFIARETNDSSIDGTLAHEGTNRSSCDDDAITSKFSPGFWVCSRFGFPLICTFITDNFQASEIDFDSFSFWEFPRASLPTPLDWLRDRDSKFHSTVARIVGV